MAKTQLSKVRSSTAGNQHQTLHVPDFDETPTNKDGTASCSDARNHDVHDLPETLLSASSFIDLPRLISKSEALRLMRVYQEAVGELHPILGPDQLHKETESLYLSLVFEQGRERTIDLGDEDVQIIVMVLSIALTAETTVKSNLATELYQLVGKQVADKIASPQISVQGVALVLLRVRTAITACTSVTKIALVIDRVSITTSAMNSTLHGVYAESPAAWQWSLAFTTSMDANTDCIALEQELAQSISCGV